LKTKSPFTGDARGLVRCSGMIANIFVSAAYIEAAKTASM
jgi:hypothetical protein